MIRLLFGALGLMFLLSCGNNNDAAYKQYIMQHRSATTYKFLDPNTSPIPKAKLATFKGLPYFEVNTKYRVLATFTPSNYKTVLQMPHTLNQTYDYIEAGTLSFQIDGKNMQLMSYLRLGETGDSVDLFIPFTDLTSGNTTYGGGRYLDITTSLKSGKIWVDFNLAYNPYCAYNEEYSCPIPPKQNYLPVAINAGEKYLAE